MPIFDCNEREKETEMVEKIEQVHAVTYQGKEAVCICGWKHVEPVRIQKIAHHVEVLAHFAAVKTYEEPKWAAA